jgi:hypothetical protein
VTQITYDEHGYETVDRTVMAKFSKVTAATIKWESVDAANAVEIADMRLDRS